MKNFINTATGETWAEEEAKQAYEMFAHESAEETGKTYDCFDDWLDAMIKSGELQEANEG